MFSMPRRKIRMDEKNLKSWQLNRQINISTLIQLVLPAALILGSWVNLQHQLPTAVCQLL